MTEKDTVPIAIEKLRKIAFAARKAEADAGHSAEVQRGGYNITDRWQLAYTSTCYIGTFSTRLYVARVCPCSGGLESYSHYHRVICSEIIHTTTCGDTVVVTSLCDTA